MTRAGGRRVETGRPGAPAWMRTYSDMVTLLLAFFVLLFSFSSIDARKFEEALLSMRGAFGLLPADRQVIDADEERLPEDPSSLREHHWVFVPDMDQMEEVHRQVTAALRDMQTEGVVTAEIEERGLVIRFHDNVLFDSGEADLRPDGVGVLEQLAPILRQAPNELEVEGHTDNVPIQTLRFPSNWELSTARASAVIRYFIEEQGFDPQRISATGYGEYRPVASNDTAEGRQQNRRVELVVHFQEQVLMETWDGGDIR